MEALTSDEEHTLWEAGVLSTANPKGLLNCVFLLCLRGGEEHRKLKFFQFRREERIVNKEKVCYVYTEHGSKNHIGGIDGPIASSERLCIILKHLKLGNEIM